MAQTNKETPRAPLIGLETLQRALDDFEGLGVVIAPNDKCQGTLTRLFAGEKQPRIRSQEFAEEVLRALQPGNFFEVQVGKTDATFKYDAYGFTLGAAMADKYGLTEYRHWYIGLQAEWSHGRIRAIFISIHEPDFNITTVDGTIVPCG